MDVIPAHLNRDSFRDSFKGLVALEIFIDLPIGFPINNIISLSLSMSSEVMQQGLHLSGLFNITVSACDAVSGP